MLKITRIVFYTILSLFLLDIFDVFQTKIGFLKVLVYYSILLLPIPTTIMEFVANKNLLKSIIRKGIPILTILGLLLLNPIKIIFHAQPWQTQTFTAIDENNKNHKIESQKKDIGAFGFAKRKVEVYDVTKYFYIVLSKNYDKKVEK